QGLDKKEEERREEYRNGGKIVSTASLHGGYSTMFLGGATILKMSESAYRNMRTPEAPKKSVLDFLYETLQKESPEKGEHPLDSAINQQAALYAVENTILPLLREKKDVDRCIYVLRGLMTAWNVMSFDRPIEPTKEQESDDSYEFNRELTTMLLEHRDVFPKYLWDKKDAGRVLDFFHEL